MFSKEELNAFSIFQAQAAGHLSVELIGDLENIRPLLSNSALTSEQIKLKACNFERQPVLMGYWKNITDILSAQCREEFGENADKARYIGTKLAETENFQPFALPAVFGTVGDSFAEFLKNSVEAAVKSGQNQLRMKITLAFEGSDVLIDLTDESGGFSEAFLDKFNRKKTELLQNPALELYEINCSIPSEKQDIHNSLGGKGLGLIQAFLQLSKSVDSEHDKAQAITLSNIEVAHDPVRYGAKISLRSHFNTKSPAPSVQEELLSVHGLFKSESFPNLSGVATLLAVPPSKRKKNLKETTADAHINSKSATGATGAVVSKPAPRSQSSSQLACRTSFFSRTLFDRTTFAQTSCKQLIM